MDNTLQMDIVEGKKPSVFKRLLLVLLVTVMLLCSAVYMAGFVLFKGPSAYAGQLYIRAVQEDEILSLLPEMYLTDEEIQAVLAAGDAGRQFSVHPEAE